MPTPTSTSYLTIASLRALYPGPWIEECLGTPQIRDPATGRITGQEPATEEQLAAIFKAACDEADAYVGTAYALPLPAVPPLLSSICADLARYRIYKAPRPEHIEKSYDRALALLGRIASGRATLGIPGPATTAARLRYAAPPRRLSVDQLGDF